MLPLLPPCDQLLLPASAHSGILLAQSYSHALSRRRWFWLEICANFKETSVAQMCSSWTWSVFCQVETLKVDVDIREAASAPLTLEPVDAMGP